MTEFLSSEYVLKEYHAATRPKRDGHAIRVEWCPYLPPPAPMFAHVEGEWQPRLLVEYGDG